MADLFDKCAANHASLVTDGLFSMEGDVCDLPALATLARRFGA